METEQLAKELHEGSRELIDERHSTNPTFVNKFEEWIMMTEYDKELTRSQADYLNTHFKILTLKKFKQMETKIHDQKNIIEGLKDL